MSEAPEARLKRMKMRAWRRGTKEMDLMLGPFADAHLAGMDPEALAAFDALLEESDQDLMRWVLGQDPAPAAHDAILGAVADFARQRLRSDN
jgi:antitoxin CptB